MIRINCAIFFNQVKTEGKISADISEDKLMESSLFIPGGILFEFYEFWPQYKMTNLFTYQAKLHVYKAPHNRESLISRYRIFYDYFKVFQEVGRPVNVLRFGFI